ncbi:hypothetical protein CV102_14770 [Natronococcus pandeyae]|uniref:Uncharacterized protein n=1 Tax=Natronococcus pandeyae TaxID=2055836 RepID=A0A8J8Q018_9EURY|nr:hypothetical protein CV102_14770 [Natronococcus pandeyae]
MQTPITTTDRLDESAAELVEGRDDPARTRSPRFDTPTGGGIPRRFGLEPGRVIPGSTTSARFDPHRSSSKKPITVLRFGVNSPPIRNRTRQISATAVGELRDRRTKSPDLHRAFHDLFAVHLF